MAKYYDRLGFVFTSETDPGIWSPRHEEYLYGGDITQTTASWNDSNRINGDLEINHTLSLICDSFLTQNLFALRYACYCGRRWRIRKIEVRNPRMILTLGSEYIIEGGAHDRITSDQNQASCHTT